MTPDAHVSTIAFGQHREKGPVREENQDQINNFQSSVFGHLFLVADGMGGHEDGAIAANMAITGFKQHFQTLSKTHSLREALAEAARLTNLDIYEKSEGLSGLRMGSTLVVCVISGNSYTVAHIGDSRCYSFRNGVLDRLTKDHTAVQKLVDLGTISPEEARTHPDASVLTRALGQRPSVEMEISPERTLAENEVLLLCSDGLYGYVDDDLIADRLQRNPDPQRAADALLELALEAGGHDNISIYVIRVESGVPRVATAPDPPMEAERADATGSRHAASLSPAAAGGRRRRLILILPLLAAAIAAGPVFLYLRPDLIPPVVKDQLRRFGVALPGRTGASPETEAAAPSGSRGSPRSAAAPVVATPLEKDDGRTREVVKPAPRVPANVVVAYSPSDTAFMNGVDNIVDRLRKSGYQVSKSAKPPRNGGVWEAVVAKPESFAPPQVHVTAVFLAGYASEAANICALVFCSEPDPKQLRAKDTEMFEKNFAGRNIFLFVHPAVPSPSAGDPRPSEKATSQ